MKIMLLLANCNVPLLKQCVEHMRQVLEELDLEVKAVDLVTLPYFQSREDQAVQALVEDLEDCKGIIACSNVHIGGMHGAMQTFFEHMTLCSERIEGQPMFVLTYSDWIDEIKGANAILGNWQTLGGSDGGKICLNQHVSFEKAQIPLEKSIEAFYRMIKQERPEVISNERRLFIEKFKVTARDQKVEMTAVVIEQPSNLVNLSTEEQNIQELTALLKGQMKKKDDTNFTQYNPGIYQKPQASISQESKGFITKKLQSLPHYFIAKHEKELDFSIQFSVTDTGEEGTIWIKEGDCHYKEGKIENATVEIAATDKILLSILSKEMTYQKAFMLGRIKVRGNFVFLSKIDQVFKGI